MYQRACFKGGTLSMPCSRPKTVNDTYIMVMDFSISVNMKKISGMPSLIIKLNCKCRLRHNVQK